MHSLIASLGVGILLSAFFANSLDLLRSDSLSYQLANVFGAGIAAYASYLIEFVPFVVLEGVWCLVALVALIRSRLMSPVS